MSCRAGQFSVIAQQDQAATVGPASYARSMTTLVRHVSRDELLARRNEILEELRLTEDELEAKVEAGGLVGREWSAWSEIEDIDYLLGS